MTAEGRKPNILFITCDQWRGDCLGAVGHPSLRTPNIDALAREGVLFKRHYAGAAPCAPARACLYTGLYQMNNRVCVNGTPLDARHDTIASAARRAGYDPTLFGYTDVAPDPRRHAPDDPALRSYEGVLPGFTVRQFLPEHQAQWLSWLSSARGIDTSAGSPAIHAAPAGPGAIGGAPVYSGDETETAFIAGEFTRWLGEQPPTAPWFAHVSFIRPHPPFVVPAPYNTMYAPGDGPAFSRHAGRDGERRLHPLVRYQIDTQQKRNFIAGAKGAASTWDEDAFDRIRAVYFGMITEVDAQLGRIWRSLEAAGAWNDTVIVLTSDHAEMMGDHFLLGKGGFFEQSYHIPLVIRDPGRPAAGAQIGRFTEAVDVMPTLLDIMGLPVPPQLDGQSLRPFLDGETPGRWRDAAHWEFDFRGISGQAAETHFGLDSRQCNLAVIRDGRFKYVHFGGGLPSLLFDLENDPGELVNLAGDAGYMAVRLDCAERLLQWRARHLDQSLALAQLTPDGVSGAYAPLHP